MSAVLGIDPGLDGACALVSPYRGPLFFDTPTLNIGKGKTVRREYNIAAMAQMLKELKIAEIGLTAALEKIHSMPGQGVRSMFSMGEGYGTWKGLLTALGIPFDLITPNAWKGEMMAGMGKDKDASRQRAGQLFPDATADLARKKDHNRADALLLAEYARRKRNGG